jgi:hypothetical protein
MGDRHQVDIMGDLDMNDKKNILSVFGLLGHTNGFGTAAGLEFVYSADPRNNYYGGWLMGLEPLDVWQLDEKTGYYWSVDYGSDKLFKYYSDEYKMRYVPGVKATFNND